MTEVINEWLDQPDNVITQLINSSIDYWSQVSRMIVSAIATGGGGVNFLGPVMQPDERARDMSPYTQTKIPHC